MIGEFFRTLGIIVVAFIALSGVLIAPTVLIAILMERFTDSDAWQFAGMMTWILVAMAAIVTLAGGFK